jgi:hypothetical protein
MSFSSEDGRSAERCDGPDRIEAIRAAGRGTGPGSAAQPPAPAGVATPVTGTVDRPAITFFQSNAGPKSHLP